ncbi:unnamed protein product [Eruca vesicaria subsp. sativa]|uniref:Uncharacterized protein n=1 Tax=Eruca vesicaria subsp. sativa TaxID=29727 RepID=A0ABC8IR76_ERUVS|nr:unnamed protein product [Eruca vesicaria subsp. sativa]
MAGQKQAMVEAETETAEYKTSTEHGFEKKLEETRGYSCANVKRFKQESGAKIEQLKNKASRISKVIFRKQTIVG